MNIYLTKSMKKRLMLVALVMGVTSAAFAAGPKKSSKKASRSDSVRVKDMQELVVKAVIAPKDAPIAVSKINKQEIEEFARTGQELPFLFARTPGVLAWSENGVGTGTSYMRIRGAAGSRINVTLDGVALNSPEDQCVFWANMNSYASILGKVEIQRGVGTSTNGDGAFGGSIALQTEIPSLESYSEYTGSGGSYGTWHVGGKVGSNLIANHLIIDGSYYHTATQGYLHGTNGSSGSWHVGATWFSTNRRVKISYKHIGNYENTGQAWNGVVAGDDANSLIDGSNLKYESWKVVGNYPTGIYTYADMYNAGLGQFNNLYERLESKGGVNTFADANGNYVVSRYQMNDGSYWPRTTDNFWQNHNLLNASWKINDHWSTSATLHYTYGRGYYDEFKYGNESTDYGTKLEKFGMSRSPEAGYDFCRRACFVRQKGLTQHTYGLVWNASYTSRKFDLIGGVSVQRFEGNHYGYVTYCSDNDVSNYYLKNGNYKYYDSDANKLDAQVFAKATIHISKNFDLYGDIQYRQVGYNTDGVNDKYTSPDKGYTIVTQNLNIGKNYSFLNPKVGFTFHKNGHKAYVSYALSHREPERNNFTDNGKYAAPEAERVHDVELGYTYQRRNWYAGLNLYGMFYRNQLVQTGEKSDIGENLTTNIKNSYRLGMELSFGYNPTSWLTVEGNAAISRNQILDFDEVVETYNDYFDNKHYTQYHYDNSTLAFSPTAILNGFLTLHKWGASVTWHTNYVSRQYLDNTCNSTRMLPHYSSTAIHVGYDWKIGKKFSKIVKNIVLGGDFNNIFNSHYAASGWVYSAIVGSAKPNEDRYTQIGFIPVSGFTAMGSLTLKF